MKMLFGKATKPLFCPPVLLATPSGACDAELFFPLCMLPLIKQAATASLELKTHYSSRTFVWQKLCGCSNVLIGSMAYLGQQIIGCTRTMPKSLPLDSVEPSAKSSARASWRVRGPSIAEPLNGQQPQRYRPPRGSLCWRPS